MDERTTNKHSRLSVAAISNVNTVSVDRSTFKISVNQNNDSNDKLPRIANWLTSINFRTIQQDTFSKHTPGTGKWLIGSSEYQEWISGHSRLLWAKGLPGAGKTILSSILIQDLRVRFSSDQCTAIMFAYCRYTDRYSVIDILSSFVKQLLQDHPSVALPIVEPNYDDHQSKETRLCERDLKDLLEELFKFFHRTYIIIDALDEFPHDDRDDLLNALSSLRANILLTSRPMELRCFVPNACFCVEAENRKDIESFIDKQIERNSRLVGLLERRPMDRKEVCAKLVQRSQGMFLIAALQIDSLKHSISLKKLHAAVDSLPSGINAMYECTWGRIEMQDPEEVSLATKAIVWLTYAYRSLKISELQDAVAVLEEMEEFDEAEVSPPDLILSVCCGLIVVDEKSGIVRLVHYTAYDFFREYSSGLFATPHTFITRCCLAYLSAFDFVNRRVQGMSALDLFLRIRPLLDYAYSHWGPHSKACYGEGSGLPTAVRTFLSQCGTYPHRRGNFGFDLMKASHVAAYYGLGDVLPMVMTNELCNEVTQFSRRTPLVLASSQGHEETVKSLLSFDDIDINLRDNGGQTAIFVASKNGHERIVTLLLSQSSVAINTMTRLTAGGQTPLIVACRNGHEEIVKLLLSRKDVDVNMATRSELLDAGETALYVASRGGHEGIVKLLLSRKDIYINTTTTRLFGDSYDVVINPALVGAAYGGCEGIVRLLLSRSDVNINSQDSRGRTALFTASKHGDKDIVKLLLSRNDVDLNTTSGGCIALYKASRNGHEGVVKLLLSRNGIIVNPALIGAADGGRQVIVRLLLSRKDVDINSQDGDGRTALFAASENGDADIVKLLLSRDDVDLNTTSGGCTALYKASRNGHEGVVKLLLSRNSIVVNPALVGAADSRCEAILRLLLSRKDVDTNSQDGDGRTALFAASENGDTDMVKLLLSRDDVDLNTTSGGYTALYKASRNGHEGVVKLLLSRNGIIVNPALVGAADASRYGREEIVKLLLFRSVDVNTEAGGRTALYAASQNCHEGVVKLLLSRNDVIVNPAIVGAADGDSEEIVRLLLSRKDVDVNSRDEDGRTALFTASENGDEDIVKLLLSRDDVDLNTEVGGCTALYAASQNGHTATVELLHFAHARRNTVPK